MITKLVVENVKKIGKFEAELGQFNLISGKKQIGKSTIINALSFLLTGQIMTDNAVGINEVESLLPNGKHDAVAMVEATLDDGTTIKKEYFESWSKTRGTSEYKFDGRKTNLFINNVSVSVDEFDKQIKQLFNYNPDKINAYDKSFNYISFAVDPLYLFYKTEWKVAKNVIESVVGKVTDEDLLNSKLEYEAIKEDVRTYGPMKKMDQARLSHRKKADALRKDKETQEAVLKALQCEFDEDKYLTLKAMVDNTRVKIVEARANVESEQVAMVKNDLSLLNLNYNENFRFDMKQNVNEELVQATASMEEAKTKYYSQKAVLEQLSRQRGNTYQKCLTLKEQLDNFKSKKADYELELNRALDLTQDLTKCPHCGGILNSLESMKKFDADKQSKIDYYKGKIEDALANITRIRADFQQAKTDIAHIDTQLSHENSVSAELQAAYEKELEAYNIVKAKPFDPISSKTKDYAEKIKAKQSELDNLLANENRIKQSRTLDLQTELDSLEAEYEPLATAKGNQARAREQEALISSTTAHLNQEEALELLVDSFIKDQARSINENAEKKLGVEFCLAETQVNGGLKDVCYPMLNGVPYNRLSTSEKIELGFKVQQAILKLDNADSNTLPILFDRAEAFGNKEEIKQFGPKQVLCSWTDGSNENILKETL